MKEENEWQQFIERIGVLSVIIIIAMIIAGIFGGTEVKACPKYEHEGAEPIESIRVALDKSLETFEQLKTEIEIIKDYTVVTEEELNILYRITESEATSGTMEQKMNIAWCVINRVNEQGKEFPNTIEEVVFQKMNGKYQFSPIADNRYYEVVITEDTKIAVENVLKNIGKHDGLWFMARSASESDNITWFDSALNKLFEDGVHEYFGRK